MSAYASCCCVSLSITPGRCKIHELLNLEMVDCKEPNCKGSAKEEEVSRVLSGFSLTLRLRKKFKLFFTNRRLILASVFNSIVYVSVKH